MRKQILSVTLDPQIIEAIERIAHTTNLTKSAVARNVLDLVVFFPPEAFHRKSQLPEILGFHKEVKNAD